MLSMNTKALFTIIFGEVYQKQWRTYAEPSWRAYADRHGYDIVAITEPICLLHDLGFRTIHWQKLFIASHPEAARYDRIVFMDSDIMINYHRAPCIVAGHDPERIGAVRFDYHIDDPVDYSLIFLRQAKFVNYRMRSEQRGQVPHALSRLSGPDYAHTYRSWTDHPEQYPLLNSGVLVIQPAKHRDLLEKIYHDSLREVPSDVERGKAGEQDYLMFKLLQAGMVQFLDERFNTIAHLEIPLHYPFLAVCDDERLKQICYTTVLANSYFLHFAGQAADMRHALCNEDGDFAILGLKDVFKGDTEIIRNHPARRVRVPG